MQTKALHRTLVVGILALGLIVLSFSRLAFDVSAGSSDGVFVQPTAFPTPTPRADGRIVYIVQPDDTLWRIAAIAGLSLEELMALNGIQPGDFLTPGTELFLGSAGPAVEPGADLTAQAGPTEVLLTPTPQVGTGDICVMLFEDLNGNGSMDADELALEGGQVSVVALTGDLIGEYTTEALDLETNPDGYCFVELANGEYNVSAAVPPNHNPTTGLNVPITLNPGEIKYLQFGAQPGSAVGLANGSQGEGRSTWLGLLGLILLAAAGGVAYYASRMSRRSPSSFR